MGDSYYSEYRGKRRRRRERRHRGCGGMMFSAFLRLLLTIILLAALAVGALYVLPVSFLNLMPENRDISVVKGLPADKVNILLLGLDVLKDGQQRCDGIMVASIGNNELKLTSLQRDTEVSIPGYSGTHKLNAAYSYGGPELTMTVVNQTFGLNITDYIAVDFETMVNTVDAIGGIDLTIEDNELEWYNKYAYKTWRVLCSINPDKYSNYLTAADEVMQAGDVHMDGLHATGYCRIRYADSDYGRTYRQRKVLTAMLTKIKDKFYDPVMYVKLGEAVFGSLKTSMSPTALMSVGVKILGAGVSGNIQQYRVPQNEYIRDNGSTIEITDLAKVKSELHSFIYS